VHSADLIEDAAKQQCQIGRRGNQWRAGAWWRSAARLLHLLPCHSYLVIRISHRRWRWPYCSTSTQSTI